MRAGGSFSRSSVAGDSDWFAAALGSAGFSVLLPSIKSVSPPKGCVTARAGRLLLYCTRDLFVCKCGRWCEERGVGVVARAGRWGWLNALSERDFTKCLVKMSGMSALPPPPSDYYAKKNAFLVFAEAVAAGRRPRSATGSGSAGCLHDRYYTTLLYWCAAGPRRGVRSKTGVSYWLPLVP